MEGFVRWLRSLGSVGGLIANIVGLLTTNWVLAMSALAGITASLWTFAASIAQSPDVRTGVFVFLAVLWTSIGVSVLVDRRRPRETRPHQDYSYGLTFDALMPHFDILNEKATLGFGIALRNYTPNPIFYVVERFDVRFGKRSLPPVEEGKLKAYIPRGGARGSSTVPFEKDDIKDLLGKEVNGTIDIAIKYGHPEQEPERRLVLTYKVILWLPDAPGALLRLSEDIVSERDEPIAA